MGGHEQGHRGRAQHQVAVGCEGVQHRSQTRPVRGDLAPGRDATGHILGRQRAGHVGVHRHHRLQEG
eukprot:13103858-Heterocapsa_arctica.AAC.1